MPLNPDDFPELGEQRINAINALNEDQIVYEIERGNDSRFGGRSKPALVTALTLIKNDRIDRANKHMLAEAREANRIAKHARIWSGIAVLVASIALLINRLDS